MARALDGFPRVPLLQGTGRDAARIQGEGWSWSTALAEPMEAGIATLRGDRTPARRALLAAGARFLAAGMALHRAVARHRRGELIGGAVGRDLMVEAEAMVGQGICRPAQVISMLAPGALCGH
ncbi:MAG: hypothetical protein RMK29_03200 [Myxococcales bacterium]|nr:hypothetical protein [Myxococcales bacterium]